MPYYRVMLRGHNFDGSPISEPGTRHGLYTTRFVQALSAKRAGLKAMELAWRDPELEIPDAERDEDRAWLTISKIGRVSRLPRLRGGGAVWFSDNAGEAKAYQIECEANWSD